MLRKAILVSTTLPTLRNVPAMKILPGLLALVIFVFAPCAVGQNPAAPAPQQNLPKIKEHVEVTATRLPEEPGGPSGVYWAAGVEASATRPPVNRGLTWAQP